MDTKLEVVLKPDIEAVLFQRAEAEGLSLDQFAARVLETMALTQSPRSRRPRMSE